MPISIIVEDGTIVTNANSYVDVDDARTYALNRGVTLSSDDDVVASMLILATDYLESFAEQYVGQPVDVTTQSLSWPRKWVQYPNWTPFPDNSIPSKLIAAQCQLCIEQFNGVVLMPTTDFNSDGGFITVDKIDVIETHYSEKVGTTKQPIIPAVDALLYNLLRNRSLGGAMVIRA